LRVTTAACRWRALRWAPFSIFPAEVLACAERAAAHWQAGQAGARERGTAIGLRGLGYRLAKDYPAAILAYREALELYRSLSPKSTDVALALNSLAGALQRQGQLDEERLAAEGGKP
jgi:hypothetical protein